MVTKTVYKQIRGFVFIWLSITFVVGLSTFLAIYFTYNPSAADPGSSNPLPLESPEPETPEEEPAPAIVLPSVTPEPTSTPTPVTPEPTVPVMAHEATDVPRSTSTPIPSQTPTLLPVVDMRYQVGIQVQQSPDFNPDSQDAWYNSVANRSGFELGQAASTLGTDGA